MPYYFIRVDVHDQLKGRKAYAAIRFESERDIERVYQRYYYLADKKFSTRMKKFTLYGLSKQSDEIREFLGEKNKDNFTIHPDSLRDEPHDPVPKTRSRKEAHSEDQYKLWQEKLKRESEKDSPPNNRSP